MLSSKSRYRILYADTDQMGVVYYGNYAKFYEIGRAEMVRDMGYSYKMLEDSGAFMPIATMSCKYRGSLYYDELITIETTVKEIPQARMVFYHNIYNAKDILVHTAEVTLVFLSKETMRPVRAPEALVKVMKSVAAWPEN